jgi:hypothetical protein
MDVTVIFEARQAEGIQFSWENKELHFKAVFLSDALIKEKRIDFKIRRYLRKELYDFIVATNYSYFTEMFAILYMQRRKIPYMLEIDGAYAKSESKIRYFIKKQLICAHVIVLHRVEVIADDLLGLDVPLLLQFFFDHLENRRFSAAAYTGENFYKWGIYIRHDFVHIHWSVDHNNHLHVRVLYRKYLILSTEIAVINRKIIKSWREVG